MLTTCKIFQNQRRCDRVKRLSIMITCAIYNTQHTVSTPRPELSFLRTVSTCFCLVFRCYFSRRALRVWFPDPLCKYLAHALNLYSSIASVKHCRCRYFVTLHFTLTFYELNCVCGQIVGHTYSTEYCWMYMWLVEVVGAVGLAVMVMGVASWLS